jgi:DNA polymerase-3 subunit gamma/tau
MAPPDLFGDDPALSRPATPAPAADESRGQTSSLYRRYRPRSFDPDDLVGQEHVVQTLRNAIMRGRVAHAYLFCGPRGTGKTTTARLLAKAVNCLAPEVDQRPCNACAACDAINSGATTDVIEIDAASNRGIDDIRDLRERIKYAPTQLRTKFYIIDEAHQITGAAANAFLKTLEEPPPHTKFVLATTDPEELLPTIVSRCQRFDFRRIGVEHMVGRLKTVAAAEGLQADDDALVVIARYATGSLRDALGLLDQLAVYQEAGEATGDRHITLEAVRSLLGVSRNDRVEGLIRAIADRDAGAALELVNAAVDAGEDARQLNKQLVAALRALMFARAGKPSPADPVSPDLAERFSVLELATLAHRFSEVDYRIKHSSYAQLPLEVAVVEATLRGTAAAAAPTAGAAATLPAPSATGFSETGLSPEDLAARPPTTSLADRVRGRGPAAGAGARPAPPVAPPIAPPTTATRPDTPPAATAAVPPAPQPTPAATTPAATGDLTVERIAEVWGRIRDDIKARDRKTEALLSSADPWRIDGDLVTIAAAYEFHAQRLGGDKERAMIAEAIERHTGHRVRIETMIRGQAPRPNATGSAPPPGGPAVAPPLAPAPAVASTLPRAATPAPDPAPTSAAQPPATRLPDPLDDAPPPPEPDDDYPAPASRSRAAAPGGPSASASGRIDQQRIDAARNLFDADIIDS